MSRPESLARAAALALVCAASLTAAPARAGMGVLWNELVCTTPEAAAGKFDFDQSFVGLPDCQKLCSDARTVCRRHVDDAASCQRELAKEWIAVDQAVDCAGLRGSRLADCKDGWALDLAAWRSAILSSQSTGRITCELELFGFGSNPGCLKLCTGQ